MIYREKNAVRIIKQKIVDKGAFIDMNEDIIYGRNPITEALESGRTIDKLFVQEGLRNSAVGRLQRLARECGVRCIITDKRRLDKLTEGANHQGFAAVCAAHSYTELEDILSAARNSDIPPLLVAADGLTDPQNLGSIIRTANAAGAHGVIIPKNRSVSLNSVVAKVSAGAVEYTPVARVTNLAQTLERLKKEGFWIAGTDLRAEQYHYDADLTVPLAIVIGSEGKGMSRIVREACDFLVKIPMPGRIESLNASVAAGVLLYEVLGQRMNKGKAE